MSIVPQMDKCLKLKSIRGYKMTKDLCKITPWNATNFMHLSSCGIIVNLAFCSPGSNSSGLAYNWLLFDKVSLEKRMGSRYNLPSANHMGQWNQPIACQSRSEWNKCNVFVFSEELYYGQSRITLSAGEQRDSKKPKLQPNIAGLGKTHCLERSRHQ